MTRLTRKALVLLLAFSMMVSVTGCVSNAPVEDNSSSSSISQEDIDALKAENERLQQELDNLKSETADDKQDTETESDSDGEETDTQTSSAPANTSQAPSSKPATSSTESKPEPKPESKPVQQPADNTPKSEPVATKPKGNGPLANYTVNVLDKSTPAVTTIGEFENGKAAYNFYSASDKKLGSIPDAVVSQIIWNCGLSDYEDDEQLAWFTEKFNEYRGIGGETEYEPANPSDDYEFDEDEFRDEVIRLTNIERKKAGLEPFEVHETAMEFAQIRAEELPIKFSHTRPNGGNGEYSHYEFGENIAKGQKTPKDVVDDWMNSPGHRAAILSEADDYGYYIGVGVHKESGTIYWTQEFVWWDSEA